MNYQQKRLSDLSDIGSQGPLPDQFQGLADESLADLYWAPDWGFDQGYVGTGFFPVIPEPGLPPVPGSVSRAQAKLALNAAGLLGLVEAAIAAADVTAQIYWTDMADFHRDHPTLLSIAAALEPPLSSDQIDDLFRAAILIS